MGAFLYFYILETSLNSNIFFDEWAINFIVDDSTVRLIVE